MIFGLKNAKEKFAKEEIIKENKIVKKINLGDFK